LILQYKHFSPNITIKINWYAASSANTLLAPVNLEHRTPGERGVQTGVLFCGVGHPDGQTVRNEWKGNTYDRLLKGDVKYRFLVDMAAL